MDPEQAKAAVEALKNGDAAGALAILEAMIVAAVSGEETAEGDPSASDPAMAAAADPLAADPEPPPAKLAALSALRSVTGCASLGEALIVLSAWKASRDVVAAQTAALDESTRGIMVGELVKLGAETPATAFAEGKMCARLTSEPIADMRTRLVSLRAANTVRSAALPPIAGPRSASPSVEAPTGGKVVTLSDGRQVAISAAELVGCKAKGMTHEDFATRKAASVKRV